MEVVNYLLGYENLKIVQNGDMFHFSLDSVLLPNFITLSSNVHKILDIGCGNAPIPLILSTKTSASILGIDIQSEVCEMARKSVHLNHLDDQITIINQDIIQYSSTCESDYFDVITCNPPFFKVHDMSKFNISDYKTIARHEIMLNLKQLCQVSKKILKNNGVLGIVHRPERLMDILFEMRSCNIEPKRIQFVYPRKNQDSHILLVEGRKNGNPGMKILPPLYVHEENGDYTEQVKKFFEVNKNVPEEL